MMRKWIRIAGPGEWRGEGSWQLVRGELMEADFEKMKMNGFLPVAWEVAEETIVKDQQGGEPRYVMRNEMLVHQFFRVATTLANRTPQAIRYSQQQLANLLKNQLIIDGEISDEQTTEKD